MIDDKNSNEIENLSVVIFEIEWEQFVVNISDVREIVQAGQIRKRKKI
ncbi:MAG: hypothetical protein KGD57_07025 [Candidatus Lokiarchaeota archaeon]|nr:hypothetical protein [Candidatus Lokiarchaeota archaeon]